MQRVDAGRNRPDVEPIRARCRSTAEVHECALATSSGGARDDARGSHQVTDVMHIERDIVAPREDTWEACATSHGIARWQADEVRGEVARGSSIVLGWPALGARVDLRVLEIEPQTRVVLASGDARVALTLVPSGVRLEHRGLADGDEREGVASSWRVSLAILAQHLERHRGRDRKVEWFVRRARTSAAAAHAFFTDGPALGSWLARRGSVGPEGEAYEIELASGAPMSGRVLSHTPGRDLALEWREQDDSVLVLRTLPSPLDASERLIALSWSRWSADEAPAALCDELESAIDRLSRILGGPATA